MNHSDRLALARRTLFLMIITAVCAAPPLLAGNSKVTGRVTDRRSGEALAGANIMITHAVAGGGREIPLDRPMGAASDVDGYYFILNVPPGDYVVKASMVGFASEVQRAVHVESDRTITLNFRLGSTEVELEGIEVTARRELVRPDVSGTQEVISTARIEDMPVLRVDEFIGRVKGVTLVSGADGNGLSVRGGAIRETDVRLDGISLQDPRSDNSYLALNSTTIQEVQVLTGGFEAKYGGIRSGLLNIVTKDGQRDRFAASIKADFAPAHQKRFFGTSPWSNESWIYRIFAGEYAMRGVPVGDTTIPAEFRSFKGWSDVRGTQPIFLSPAQRQELWKLQHPQYEVAPKPDLFVEGSLSGPFPGDGLPLIGEYAARTTFLLGFKYENSQLAFPIGPRNNYLDWNGQIKLTTRLGENMKLALNGIYASIRTSSAGRASSYGGALIDQNSSFGFLGGMETSVAQQAALIGGASLPQLFNLSRLQLFDQRYILGGAKFTHALSDKAYYTLELQAGYTDQQLMPFAMDTSDAGKYASFYSASQKKTLRYYLPQYGSPNASTNYGFDPLNHFAMYGGPQRIDSSYTWVYQLKGDVTAQIGRYHQVEAGVSARLQKLFVYTGTWFQSQTAFTPDTWTYYKVTPLEGGLYVQDKLELRGMVLNAGLRLDYLNPMKKGYDASFPLPDQYQSLYNDVYPSLPGLPMSYERWKLFREYLESPEGWPESENRVQLHLSPRLGVSFPVTEASKLYFNYGHFYQRPAIAFMYNTDLNLGSVGLPTPDLDMARTVSYEFGYEQMILDDFLVNVTAYYKNITGEPLSRRFINYYGDNIVAKYFPDAYRDVRGVELRVERPVGRFVTFTAMYDYMVQTAGKSGLAQIFENRLNAVNEVRSANVDVTEPRPRANINLNLHTPADFGPEVLGIHWFGSLMTNFLFEWRSGGRMLLNPGEQDLKLWKYADVVNRWNIDFRGSKTFETAYGDLELVVTVKNLTNNKWLETAYMLQTQYDDYRRSLQTPDKEVDGKPGTDTWGQYKSQDGHINTGWYDAPIFLNPRRVILGMRLNF